MVFCNLEGQKIYNDYITVTILILIDGFLQYSFGYNSSFQDYVTILILIDGFLQCLSVKLMQKMGEGHNPYFNRWFSAILLENEDELEEFLSQSLF